MESLLSVGSIIAAPPTTPIQIDISPPLSLKEVGTPLGVIACQYTNPHKTNMRQNKMASPWLGNAFLWQYASFISGWTMKRPPVACFGTNADPRCPYSAVVA